MDKNYFYYEELFYANFGLKIEWLGFCFTSEKDRNSFLEILSSNYPDISVISYVTKYGEPGGISTNCPRHANNKRKELIYISSAVDVEDNGDFSSTSYYLAITGELAQKFAARFLFAMEKEHYNYIGPLNLNIIVFSLKPGNSAQRSSFQDSYENLNDIFLKQKQFFKEKHLNINIEFNSSQESISFEQPLEPFQNKVSLTIGDQKFSQTFIEYGRLNETSPFFEIQIRGKVISEANTLLNNARFEELFKLFLQHIYLQVEYLEPSIFTENLHRNAAIARNILQTYNS